MDGYDAGALLTQPLKGRRSKNQKLQ